MSLHWELREGVSTGETHSTGEGGQHSTATGEPHHSTGAHSTDSWQAGRSSGSGVGTNSVAVTTPVAVVLESCWVGAAGIRVRRSRACPRCGRERNPEPAWTERVEPPPEERPQLGENRSAEK